MLKCAFYEKEITPPLGCHIPGYFSLRRGSDVKDRLYARAFVTDNGEKQIALLSIDGCTVDNPIIAPVRARITEFTGIPAENILIGYTHSHTGIPRITGFENADVMKSQEGYFKVFEKLIADCAILAYYRLQESTIEYACGEVTGISFCRNYRMKNSTPTTNPPRMSPDIEVPFSKTDNDLPILFVKNSAGEPLGAVISFACHPDCVDGTEYSGDYISELSLQLKKTYGQDFVTVFLLGCCGDINHFDVTRKADAPDHYRKMGRTIADETLNALSGATAVSGDEIVSKLEYLSIPRAPVSDEKIAEAKHIIETVKEVPDAKIAADSTDPDQYNLAMAKMLIAFLHETPENISVPLQFIKIGDFKLYAFPSEIFCHFGKMVKLGSKAPKCMVTSVCNAYFGYVPTRDIFYDTIYESLPGSNKLDREAGYLMAEKLVEMGK